MKKIFVLGSVIGGVLGGCTHDPNWHYNCARNYSEDVAANSECKARVANMGVNPTVYNTPGQVGLRADISGPRSDQEARRRPQDDL